MPFSAHWVPCPEENWERFDSQEIIPTTRLLCRTRYICSARHGILHAANNGSLNGKPQATYFEPRRSGKTKKYVACGLPFNEKGAIFNRERYRMPSRPIVPAGCNHDLIPQQI